MLGSVMALYNYLLECHKVHWVSFRGFKILKRFINRYCARGICLRLKGSPWPQGSFTGLAGIVFHRASCDGPAGIVFDFELLFGALVGCVGIHLQLGIIHHAVD